MTLGLKRGTVALQPSSAEYPALFEEERARVRQALGALALDIQHVGSTSIPGLAGKPILDLAVGIQNTAQMDACISPLQAIGYTSFDDREGWGEYFFAKGDDEARTHYIHLLPISHPKWAEYLLFRDVLRRQPDLRDKYNQIKAALAEAHGNNRRQYTAQKGIFVQRVLAEFGPTAPASLRP
ncbi:GrpB family protein [Deinococcus sp. QL22]|uniref:GrpB family protein n=1 Tax=Deinococcus sp. QL22 TaxID=2939437 RepID=UPI002016CADA|nr:GrpB family protein [Deinococcus sp. QL22]UQN07422.1 GrpB family protein [Deinococcus sp. QL22]